MYALDEHINSLGQKREQLREKVNSINKMDVIKAVMQVVGAGDLSSEETRLLLEGSEVRFRVAVLK